MPTQRMILLPHFFIFFILFGIAINQDLPFTFGAIGNEELVDERRTLSSSSHSAKRTSVASMVGTDPSLMVGVPTSSRVHKSAHSNKHKHSKGEEKKKNKHSHDEANKGVNNSTVSATKVSTDSEDSVLRNDSTSDIPVKQEVTPAVAEVETAGISETPPLHDDRKFYMYDLDEEFWWRWPVDGSDCSENGYVGHEHKENSGIGPLVSADEGLFLTWHFSLFSSLFNRMKRSSRRTLDPEKASLFIIPYDLGLDGYLNAQTCSNRRQCSQGLVGKLTTMLKASKYFTRYNGADHAVLWSLGQYHPWPRAGCDVFMKTFCELCTFTCYWMDATKPDNKFVSVPFPSSYHWWDGIKQLPWDPEQAANRTMKAVYLGSIQTLNPTHTKIRRSMTQQCNASAECHWLQIGHSSKDNNIADFLTAYRRAEFCLCPPGDDPARKAVSDAIVSGCIPVIFELNTLYNQYPWHIGEQAALDISVYIPGGAVKNNQIDFMSILLKIPPEVVKKKQAALALIAPRVQYAVPPYHLLADKYDNTTWDPPFKDGVELTLDGLFDRTAHVVKKEPTHIPPKLLSGREWGRIYNVVRVQVPNATTTDYEGNAIFEQVDLNVRKRVRGRLINHRGKHGPIHGKDSNDAGMIGGFKGMHKKGAAKFHPKGSAMLKGAAHSRHHTGEKAQSKTPVNDEGQSLPSMGAPGEE